MPYCSFPRFSNFIKSPVCHRQQCYGFNRIQSSQIITIVGHCGSPTFCALACISEYLLSGWKISSFNYFHKCTYFLLFSDHFLFGLGSTCDFLSSLNAVLFLDKPATLSLPFRTYFVRYSIRSQTVILTGWMAIIAPCIFLYAHAIWIPLRGGSPFCYFPMVFFCPNDWRPI